MQPQLAELYPEMTEYMWNLLNMERRGVLIDKELCEDMHMQAESEMSIIVESLGFTPSKPTELHPFLLEELQLPVLKRSEKTGKPSFDKAVMEEYDEILQTRNDTRAKQVLAFRGWQKADSACYRSYLELVSPDGRVRPSFKMHGTITSRLSCEKPNLQQIPRKSNKPWNGKVKQCFIPQEGFQLIEFDYKTLEFRLAALYAGNQELIDRINAGEDLHQATRDMIANLTGLEFERQTIKTTNFLILYGGKIRRLATQLGISFKDAEKIYNAWHVTLPEMAVVMAGAQEKATFTKSVTYWNGWTKHYGTRWNRSKEDEEPIEKKAFNALCQGGGAQIVKVGTNKSARWDDEKTARMVLTVHDSVLWEIREDRIEELIPVISDDMALKNFKCRFDVDAHVWGEG